MKFFVAAALVAAAFSSPAFAAFPTAVNTQITDSIAAPHGPFTRHAHHSASVGQDNRSTPEAK